MATTTATAKRPADYRPARSSSHPTDDAPRVIVRMELTPEAKRLVGEVAGRYGMTQIAVSSRLVEWFAGQPEGVQAVVLGQIPDVIAADVSRLVLVRMAAAPATTPSANDRPWVGTDAGADAMRRVMDPADPAGKPSDLVRRA